MPHIELDHIGKSFGTTNVIRDFNASIADGEFLVLLGPSGCGKSTLLRMIAGLGDITRGILSFDGRRVNDWTPSQRGVAFVFQSYALYPHMTVRENIAFPLVMDAFRKWYHIPVVNTVMRWKLMRRADIAERTARIAEQLELTALLDRRPANLSGGQRQRVALARSLVRDPSLYLLDEPLSNLDAKLRTQMRAEISTLHNRVRKTFIYVTHDQVEAMTMATKIIVMNKGEIQQIGTPDQIYSDPANTFVARFVGAPPMNLLDVATARGTVSIPGGPSWGHEAAPENALMGIRPENLVLNPEGDGPIPVEVVVVERLGAETIIGCRILSDRRDQRFLDTDLVFVRVQGNPRIVAGTRYALSYAAEDVRWFDRATGAAIPHATALPNCA
ncbi:ABC transporter ATP-binding protein [Paracoccus rhizosphaerae]|uniref:ABC transporter ATP-binding protein n=1 Tax=Paracoccus rhizosphaerae TaxID=1133347 RepID=A0ABV6CKH0_9RHOB|nr:ABC transporter ATP-binding protein [Paracoccus rhizosphaerae]